VAVCGVARLFPAAGGERTLCPGIFKSLM